MLAEGIPEEFAERVFSQIRGFGEYGFPESHAASFALLAYVTAWLRCHHHDVFTCAILNAQPMGFYTPATLVEDAKRHGVEVRPVNINKSQWNCTLTPLKKEEQSPVDGAKRRLYGVRMGLRYVKGLGVVERERLETVEPPYPNLATFVRQTRLNRKAMHALAEAGAFECFGLNRRDAIWQVRSLSRFAQDALPLEPASSQISFASLASDDQVLWDYRSSHHSTRGHPMQGLRHTLRSRGIPEATRVHSRAHGDELDYVGVVICRQRPGTASGVTFFTLEDETGFVNVVVWKQVFDRHAALAKTAALLGVSGEIQKADGVIHLIAKSLWAPDVSLAEQTHRSRDFH
jgi:error-prone DNA polymerase